MNGTFQQRAQPIVSRCDEFIVQTQQRNLKSKKTEKVSSNIQRWWLNFVHILFRRCFFFLVDWKVIFLLFCRLPWQMKFECGHSWRITSIFNQNTELHQPKSVNANEFKPNEWVCFFGFWSTFCCQHFGSTFGRQFHLKYSVIKFYVRRSCLLSITRQTQMPKTVEKFIAFFCMTLKSKTIFKWIESKMIWHWIRLLFSSRTKREKTHFTGKSLEIIDASVERKKKTTSKHQHKIIFNSAWLMFNLISVEFFISFDAVRIEWSIIMTCWSWNYCAVAKEKRLKKKKCKAKLVHWNSFEESFKLSIFSPVFLSFYFSSFFIIYFV